MGSEFAVSRIGWSDCARDAEMRSSPPLIRLDSHDTTILKGLAISAIVFHNFFHAFSAAHENEFEFHPGEFGVFLQTVSHPSLALQAFFSFFGYLGVPVFIFLSAYGISRRYWDDPASWTEFMAGRVRKLFPIFGLVVLPWAIVDAIQNGLHSFLSTAFPRIFLMFTGLSPLVPGMGLPPVGPWWFIPFIIEFYAIFFVLRKVTKKFGWPGLVILAFVALLLRTWADPWLAPSHLSLLVTPIGRMTTICLGIAAARYSLRIPLALVVASSAVLVAGNGFEWLWPFTSFAALVVTLWGYLRMRSNLRENSLLEKIGRYSILIFLLNGIVRNQFLSLATTPVLQLLYGAISAMVTFAIAAIIQELLIRRPFLSGTSEVIAIREAA